MRALRLTSECIPAKCDIVAGQQAATAPAEQVGHHNKNETIPTNEQEPQTWMIFICVWPNSWKA
jgi:hypothetical protein